MRPSFDRLAEMPANPVSAKAVSYDQSSYDGRIFRLKMTLYGSVDPTRDRAIQFGDENDLMREKGKAFDPRSHFGCIARVA